MSIVLPIGISFHRWASTLQTDFSTEEVPLPPADEKNWKSWAIRVVDRNVFNNDNIPDPRHFETWQLWASRVAQALNA